MIVASASAPYERNTLRGFADLELGGHERPRVFPKLSNRRPRYPVLSFVLGSWRNVMSLGKRKSGGNSFMPLLKFDARVGRFYLEQRVQTSNGWEKQQTDITDHFHAVFDLATAERGWIKFPRGAPPETVLVPAGEDPGEAPSEDHKEGFRVLVQVDGVVHEFMSTSVGAWNAVNALHDVYIREAPKHPGEAPEVALHDIVERRYTSGSSFEPSFIITQWVPRPDERKQRSHADLDDEAKISFLDD